MGWECPDTINISLSTYDLFALACFSHLRHLYPRMYDRIEQPALLPLFPATKTPATQPQSTSHSAQRSPVCVSAHTPGLSPTPLRAQQPPDNSVDPPGSRHRSSTQVRSVSRAVPSQSRPGAFVPEAPIVAGRARSMDPRAPSVWWASRQHANGNSDRRTAAPINVHSQFSSRASTVPVSRVAGISDARAGDGSGGAVGGTRKAWQRVEGDVRDTAVGKGMALATTRHILPPVFGGARRPSQQIPAQWRTGGKASAAAAAVAAEAARRGDERRGRAWGNSGTGSWT